jgi:hypothetical protein
MNQTEFGCPTIRFTDHPNRIAEDRVRSDIDHIVNAVIGAISPRAIILAGSFGRGEGSVHIDDDHVHVFSDYEIGVVTNKIWLRPRIVALSRRLSQELGADVSLFWVTTDRLKHNKLKNLSLGNHQPTVFAYDLKAGSVLLYGNLNLHKNRILPEDLPPWEGFKLFVNRLAEFLFKADLMEFREWVGGQNAGTRLPLAKCLLAAADGLIVASGNYVASSRRRLDIFLDKNPLGVDLSSLTDPLQNALNHRIQDAEWQGIPWESFTCFVFDALKILIEKTFDSRLENIAQLPSLMHSMPVSLEHFVQYDSGWLPISPVAYESIIQKRKLKNAGLGEYFKALSIREMIPSLMLYSMIPGMVILGNDHSPEKILQSFLDAGIHLEDNSMFLQDIWSRWDSIRRTMKPIWKTIG